MHYLLERQIKKIFKDPTQLPPEWETFAHLISTTYTNFDNDRTFLEHSFDVSSNEFQDLNNKVVKLLEELKIEKESVSQKVIERTKELTLANERLLELDKVKTEFISVAAHQLRTPLSAIKWTLSILLEDPANLTADQRTLLMKGYESNQRIINLINDMLVVARIESGKTQYSFTPVRIEDIINSVLLDFTNNAQNIKVSFEEPSTPLPYISADPEKIRGVLQNLVENALFYTPKGGQVSLRASLENDVIKVSVEDTGIGIPQQQQSSIFNKFFRADNAAKVRTDGSGLGLFIARTTIEKHGGTIGFTSELGKGTTFYFTLPTSTAAATPN